MGQQNEDIEIFKAKIQSLIEFANERQEPVINADETGFQILPNYVLTWSNRGSKTEPLYTEEDLKDRVSVMASITSDYEKLPLYIIGKGNNIDEARRQCGELIGRNKLSYSSSSYMTSDCFLEYLDFLRENYSSDVRIHLIIDPYSTHTSLAAKLKAAKLNILLYLIPSGMTDSLQPLDVAVFAPLKSITNSKIKQSLFGNETQRIGMKGAVRFIQEAYECISTDTLIRAWEQYK